MSILQQIQSELKAPKTQTNKFGGYNFRSCEDILEAVKPLLAKHKAKLTISDDLVAVGSRVYVKATARFVCGDEVEFTSGYAREAETKKGMDEAQITGSASSYARKYALNGLFCIDDTKDADATNTHGKEAKGPTLTDEQLAELDGLIRETKTDVQKFCTFMKVSKVDDIPQERYEFAIKALERKRA